MQYVGAISKTTESSLFISKANHSISQLSKSMPQPVTLKKLKLNGSMMTYKTFQTNTQEDALSIIGDWNEKVGSQEIPVVTGKFGLGVQDEGVQRLTEFCQEKALVRANTLQETTLHMDILAISEQKCTRMGKFNSDDHCIYYCGQESLRRNGVALRVNKNPKCSTQVQSQKLQNDLSSFLRQTIQHHSDLSLCPNQ